MPRCDTGGEFCLACSFWLDGLPHLAHLHARDTSLAVNTQEPIADFSDHMKRMGWAFPAFSSVGTGYFSDLSIALTADSLQEPGISAYVPNDDEVYCTYIARERGTEPVNNTYNYLDLTHLARQEGDMPMTWLRYHDSYDES